LHVFGPDVKVIEPPGKRDANLLHPEAKGFGDISHEEMGAETRDDQAGIGYVIRMCRYRLEVNLMIRIGS
jgi:hypothetical protein